MLSYYIRLRWRGHLRAAGLRRSHLQPGTDADTTMTPAGTVLVYHNPELGEWIISRQCCDTKFGWNVSCGRFVKYTNTEFMNNGYNEALALLEWYSTRKSRCFGEYQALAPEQEYSFMMYIVKSC